MATNGSQVNASDLSAKKTDLDIFDPKLYTNILSSKQGSRDDIPTPTTEMLQAIEDLLYVYEDEAPYLLELISNYGYIQWEKSLLRKKDEDTYFITLPLKKQDNVSSVIRCGFKNNKVNFIDFITNGEIDEMIAGTYIPSEFVEKYGFFIIFDFGLSQALVENQIDPIIMGWLENYENIKTSKVSEDRWVVCWPFYNSTSITLLFESIDDGGDAIFNNYVIYVATEEDEECIEVTSGSGPGGSGNNTPPNPFWGGSGNGTNTNTDDDNEEDIEDIEDCMSLIRNSITNKAINDYLASIVFPCDDRSKNEIKNEILSQWCRNLRDEETDTDDSSGPTGKVPKFNFSDFEAALDGMDYIDKSVLKKDCPCLHQFLDDIALNNNSANWLCKFIKNINSKPSELIHQRFTITEGNSFHNNLSISQNPIIKKTNVFSTILIPKGACEGNLTDDEGEAKSNAEIGAMFLHEFLHTQLGVLIQAAYPTGPPSDLWLLSPNGAPKRLNPDHFSIMANQYSVLTGSTSANIHVAFYDYLRGLISESLKSLSGGEYENIEYYMHLIINTESIKDLIGQPDFDLGSSKTRWEEFGGADGSHSMFETPCND